jgi:hypothetical protein
MKELKPGTVIQILPGAEGFHSRFPCMDHMCDNCGAPRTSDINKCRPLGNSDYATVLEGPQLSNIVDDYGEVTLLYEGHITYLRYNLNNPSTRWKIVK